MNISKSNYVYVLFVLFAMIMWKMKCIYGGNLKSLPSPTQTGNSMYLTSFCFVVVRILPLPVFRFSFLGFE